LLWWERGGEKGGRESGIFIIVLLMYQIKLGHV
jgi:hypothetical protein